MQYTVGNVTLQEDRVAPISKPVNLINDHTGCPVFLLPSTRVERPEYKELRSVRALREMGRAPSSLLDQANEDVLNLFFRSGGRRAGVVLLPLAMQDVLPTADELWKSLDGVKDGFRTRTGIYSLLDHEDFGDLLLAPTLSLFVDPPALTSMTQAILQVVEQSEKYFAILDAPLHGDVESWSTTATQYTSGRAALYAGHFIERTTRKILPLSPFAAATYERNDRERAIDYTPANLSTSLPTYELADISEEDAATLEARGINSVRRFSDHDIRLWGSRTLWKGTEYKRYIACSRFMMAFCTALEEILAPFVWNVATEAERKIAETKISNFFDQYYDPARKGRSLDPGCKPRFTLTIESNQSKEKLFKLDVSIFLTIPMTWVDIQMAFEG